MRFTVTSNGGLERLQRRLERVARGAHRRPVAEAVGKVGVELIEQGFEEGHAPDLSPWKPTKKGNAPLIGETRDLSTSADYEPAEDGVTLKVEDWKAGFHQETRPMLPEGELPKPWRHPIEQAGAKALHDALTGDR